MQIRSTDAEPLFVAGLQRSRHNSAGGKELLRAKKKQKSLWKISVDQNFWREFVWTEADRADGSGMSSLVDGGRRLYRPTCLTFVRAIFSATRRPILARYSVTAVVVHVDGTHDGSEEVQHRHDADAGVLGFKTWQGNASRAPRRKLQERDSWPACRKIWR